MRDIWDEWYGVIIGIAILVGLGVFLFIIAAGAGPGERSYSWWAYNCVLDGSKEGNPVYRCVGNPHSQTWTFPNYTTDPKIHP